MVSVALSGPTTFIITGFGKDGDLIDNYTLTAQP